MIFSILSIITTGCLITIGCLIWKIYSLNKEKIVESISEDNFILEKPKVLPLFSDYDTDFTLLKDVIESAKLENWDVKIEVERGGISTPYEITVTNPSKSIEFLCRAYIDIRQIDPMANPWCAVRIKKFNIPGDSSAGYRNADYSGNDTASALSLNFIWKYVLDKHKAEYDEEIIRYKLIKELIQKELKTLNRDRQLKKLIEEA